MVTRYSSPFHQHQAIDLYAWQWDEDKYQELCESSFTIWVPILIWSFWAWFLLGNYKQADKILEELPVAIRVLQSGKTCEDTDYHQHLEAERWFLASCKTDAETDKDAISCEYILMLKTYNEMK